MENVVYILGAGFSAPLGLPVMSNFVSKSKDMYFNTDGKYDYFNEVFQLIERMSYIKNYYDSNLFNIEEILSILEMSNFLNGDKDKQLFIDYISEVINYYTPEIQKRKLPGNFQDFIMGARKPVHNSYGNFIASLLKLVFKRDEGQITYEVNKHLDYNYSLISLNYDRVIENYIDHLSKVFAPKDEIKIINSIDNYDDLANQIALCKLHGCVEKQNIIPPTWNKNSNDKLLQTWQLADTVLREANHIRIIGYSLPVTDSYIIYLLKSSMLNCKHLKSIDVITLDNDGQTKKNYDEFIDYSYYRFQNKNILDYFSTIKSEFDKNNRSSSTSSGYKFNSLEKAHKIFMDE